MLADYVLALLRHDGGIDDVRKLCEDEIPDFLKEGALASLRCCGCLSTLHLPVSKANPARSCFLQTLPCS